MLGRARDTDEPVVGRTQELLQLSAWIGRAVAGRGLGVVIEGEPGIGKTTLLRAVTRECTAQGAMVVYGKAGEFDRHLPFATILSCPEINAAIQRSDVVQPDDAIAVAADYDFMVTEAILDLFGTWCDQRPVALLLDDLHWADVPSLLVLHRLGMTIRHSPLFVLTTVRPSPRESELDGLLRSMRTRGAEFLTVPPLSSADVAELTSRLVGVRAGQGLLDLVAGAAGNPMYVTELVTAVRRDGRIVVVDGIADVVDSTGSDSEERASIAVDSSGGRSPSLSAAVVGRLGFLSRATREVLRVAALMGETFDVTELSAVLGRPAVHLWQAMSEALDNGVLIEAEERLQFRHDLIRQALAEHLPLAMRTALHLQIAMTLAGRAAPPERVASHLMAGSSLDHRAMEWLVTTAPVLMRRAPATAAALLGRALATAPSNHQHTRRIQVQLAHALMWAGQPEDASRAARAALSAHDFGDRALLWLLIQSLFQQGHQRQALEHAQRALDSPTLQRPDSLRLQGLIAQCHFYLGELDSAVTAGMAAAQGESEGLRAAAGFGLTVVASVRLTQRRAPEALELLDRVNVITGRGGAAPLQAIPTVLRGLTLLDLDRLTEADEVFQAASARPRGPLAKGTHAAMESWFNWGRAVVRFFDGRWDDALAEIDAAADAVDHMGISQCLASLRALIAVRRGDQPDAIVDLPDTSPAGRIFGFWRLWARALTLEAHGQPEQAIELLTDCWVRGINAVPPGSVEYYCVDLARLRLVMASGKDHKGSTDWLDDVTTVLSGRASPAESVQATAALCTAAARADADGLRQAADAYRRAGRPLYEAQAWECAAIVLARQGHVNEARVALDAALDRYDVLDAAWDSRRARRSLRDHGVRPTRRTVPPRPRSGWDALTPTESRIAGLVAAGWSNPEIAADVHLSRRTVQYHVSKLLDKLDLNSRVQLVVATHERDAGTI